MVGRSGKYVSISADVRIVSDVAEIRIDIGRAFEVKVRDTPFDTDTNKRTQCLGRPEIPEPVQPQRMRVEVATWGQGTVQSGYFCPAPGVFALHPPHVRKTVACGDSVFPAGGKNQVVLVMDGAAAANGKINAVVALCLRLSLSQADPLRRQRRVPFLSSLSVPSGSGGTRVCASTFIEARQPILPTRISDVAQRLMPVLLRVLVPRGGRGKAR